MATILSMKVKFGGTPHLSADEMQDYRLLRSCYESKRRIAIACAAWNQDNNFYAAFTFPGNPDIWYTIIGTKENEDATNSLSNFRDV